MEKLDELSVRKELLLASSYFSGGLITSVCRKEKIKDYDLFFEKGDVLAKVVQHYIKYHAWGEKFAVEVVKDELNPKLHRAAIVPTTAKVSTDAFINSFNRVAKEHNWKNKKDNVYPVFLSHNALTLSNDVQIIFRFIGEPEEVFTTFDFEHCKTYWRPAPLGVASGKTCFSGNSLECLAKGELLYTKQSRFILSAMSRMAKFVKRGWEMPPNSLVSLASSAAEVNWKDPKKLKEELLGIYGIDPETLTKILKASLTDETINLEKIIKILGEV